MKKIIILLSISGFLYSCNEHDIKKPNIELFDTTKYDIESIIYWGIGSKRTNPFIIVKADTINHIGTSTRYTNKGELFERIVIIDDIKAIKMNYLNDTISTSNFCRYKIRKDHKTKEYYSIVVW